jgi:branched-chain amino acid transport system ATP-binding protein
VLVDTQPHGQFWEGLDRMSDSLLAVSGLEVVYSDVILALRGVSLEVPEGSVVAVLGANGAGKTTLMRAITGLLDVHRGKVVKGSITLDGRDVTGAEAASLVRAGVAQVMEGRRIFAPLTVDENLRAGGYTVRSAAERRQAYERVMELFPALVARRSQTAGFLSGGEQQMVAMGRALMASPRILVLDEPSLGLAPLIVEQIAGIIREINEQGTSVVLVEQNATMALGLCDRGFVLEHGRIVKDGTGTDLLADADIQEFYLGVSSEGRRSYRDVKTYRRRKRWSA